MMRVLGRRFFLGFGTISTPAEKKSTVFLAARNVLTVKLRDHTYSADGEDRGFPIEKQSPDAWERRSFSKVCVAS